MRRLLKIAPGEMSDDDVRRGLALFAADAEPDARAADVADGVRAFADAASRAASD